MSLVFRNESGLDTLHQQIQQAVTSANLRVLGHEDIYDIAELSLLKSILQAYGQSKKGFLYAEPALMDAHLPPPDLVLAHPDLGLVVFECKAYDLSYIRGMEAGSLKIIRHGRETLVNPQRQAQRSMYAIKDAYEKFAHAGPRPLFHIAIALPNIGEEEWIRMGYHRCIDSRIILFQEQINDPSNLAKRLAALVTHTQKRVGNVNPYPLEAEKILLRVFGDSAVINDARLTVRGLESANLGQQIDALEQGHKQLSAEQQYLSRIDTWGHPYLVRGVAGSGKSIVLANQVARMLHRQSKQNAQLSLFDDTPQKERKIGVICFNRSLVSLLQERVRRAYHALSGSDLPDSIVVSDLNHLLYNLETKLGQRFFRYYGVNRVRRAEDRARKHLEQIEALRIDQPYLFDQICFDGLMIDEGQDAHPDEYAILRALVRPDPQTGERTITIFYDDAQNIYGNPPPTWRDLSLNVAGGRAAFMQESYRNSSEIVELGMNVLLGTHARHRQRVATRRFMDVHTLQEKGLIEETKKGWQVKFAARSGRLPIVRGFQSRFEQLDWAAEAIIELLEVEHVRPEQMLILAPRSTSFRYIGQRIAQLASRPVPLRLVGGTYQQHLDDLLIVPEQLTLSTIYAAKGYDAPIVFLVDIDQLEANVLGRVLFYVGVTRAKRYLVVTGLDLPNTLMREALTAAEIQP